MSITLCLFAIASLSASVAYHPPTEVRADYGVSKSECIVNAISSDMAFYAFDHAVLPTVAGISEKKTFGGASYHNEFLRPMDVDNSLIRAYRCRTGDVKLPDIYQHIKADKLYILNCQLAFK